MTRSNKKGDRYFEPLNEDNVVIAVAFRDNSKIDFIEHNYFISHTGASFNFSRVFGLKRGTYARMEEYWEYSDIEHACRLIRIMLNVTTFNPKKYRKPPTSAEKAALKKTLEVIESGKAPYKLVKKYADERKAELEQFGKFKATDDMKKAYEWVKNSIADVDSIQSTYQEIFGRPYEQGKQFQHLGYDLRIGKKVNGIR